MPNAMQTTLAPVREHEWREAGLTYVKSRSRLQTVALAGPEHALQLRAIAHAVLVHEPGIVFTVQSSNECTPLLNQCSRLLKLTIRPANVSDRSGAMFPGPLWLRRSYEGLELELVEDVPSPIANIASNYGFTRSAGVAGNRAEGRLLLPELPRTLPDLYEQWTPRERGLRVM